MTYLALRLLDIAEPKNYDGSWREWSSDEALPQEK